MRIEYNLQTGEVTEHDDAPPSIINESPEQIIARLDAAIELHIQSVISGMGYNSVERLSVYINSTNPEWKAEAIAAPKWITALWEKALQVKSDVENGLIQIPTESEFIEMMPKFNDFILP